MNYTVDDKFQFPVKKKSLLSKFGYGSVFLSGLYRKVSNLHSFLLPSMFMGNSTTARYGRKAEEKIESLAGGTQGQAQ